MDLHLVEEVVNHKDFSDREHAKNPKVLEKDNHLGKGVVKEDRNQEMDLERYQPQLRLS